MKFNKTILTSIEGDIWPKLRAHILMQISTLLRNLEEEGSSRCKQFVKSSFPFK